MILRYLSHGIVTYQIYAAVAHVKSVSRTSVYIKYYERRSHSTRSLLVRYGVDVLIYQLRKIAEALNVNVNSLVEFDIEADGDVLPLLFAIDDEFEISIDVVNGKAGMFFTDKNLIQFLKDWQAMKELLASGSQTPDNYEIWKTIRPSVTKVTHE